ncbi:MAG: TRAP transporter substrate-binding protein [Candidatus Methylomirabilales bacterium]
MGQVRVVMAGALAAALLALGGPADIRAAEFDLVEAHTTTPDHPYTLGMVRFAQLVRERSHGRINITVHHSRQLGDERQVVEGLQLGTIHLTVSSTGPLGGFVPAINVLDLPFLFRDAAHAHAVLDGEIGQSLLRKFADVGITGLAFWENGFRHMTSAKRPIRRPEDLKNLKVRVMENKVHQAAFRQLGADATPMAWGEVFTSLQQGLLDAQENPIPIIATFKLYEVQKYLSLTGHVYSPAPLLLSRKVWDRLPADLQTVMRDTAMEVARVERSLVRSQEQKQLGELKARGMVVIESPDKAAFREAMRPVFEQFEAQFGKEVVQRIRDTR